MRTLLLICILFGASVSQAATWSQDRIADITGYVEGTNCPAPYDHVPLHWSYTNHFEALPADEFIASDEYDDPLDWTNWTDHCQLDSEYSYVNFKFFDSCSLHTYYDNATWKALRMHYQGHFLIGSFNQDFWYEMHDGLTSGRYGYKGASLKIRVRATGFYPSFTLHCDVTELELYPGHPLLLPSDPPTGPPTLPPVIQGPMGANSYSLTHFGPPGESYPVYGADSLDGAFTFETNIVIGADGVGTATVTSTNQSHFWHTFNP